jgi:hypothetical protein
MNIIGDKLTNELKDIGKFLGHAMFVSVCFSLVCGFISLIYGIIFYFGFVNTMITINIICMLSMSSLVNLFKQELVRYFSKSNIGNKILELLNYYYNTYIISKKYCDKIAIFSKYIFQNYVWMYTKIIFNKFMKINNELCDNKQSIVVKNKLDVKYSNAKNYFVEQIVQPYFIKSFQDALENDPFSLMNPLNPSGTDFLINSMDKNQYKNNVSNENMNMNTSFLTNNKLNEKDNLDDLDDNEIDLKNVPEVSKKQIEDAEKLEKEITVHENKKPILNVEDKRAALRNKMAEKRTARTGGRNPKAMQQNMANIMNMPGMSQMMETMMKGDNLEKLMKQIPQDKLGKHSGAIDPEQMKQLIKSMNKK